MPQRIPVILASANQSGNSAQLVGWFTAAANAKRYEFDFIRLYQLKIEPFTNENRKADYYSAQDQDARGLITKIEQAEQVIITTPIWNFSVPGVLKNLLDRWLTSGRVWSEAKQRKVANWQGKKFYLLFTMGAPWYLAWPNYLGVAQVVFTLWYYGASCKLVKIVYHCGKDLQSLVVDRPRAQKSLRRKGRRLFA